MPLPQWERKGVSPTENSKDSFLAPSFSETLNSAESLHHFVQGVTLDEIVAAATQVQKMIQHLSSLQTALANLVAAKRFLTRIKEPLSTDAGKIEPMKDFPLLEGRAQANSLSKDTPLRNALSLGEDRIPAVPPRTPEAPTHPIISGKEKSSTARLDDFTVRGKQLQEEKVAPRVSVSDSGRKEERSSLREDTHPILPSPPKESLSGSSSSQRDREPTQLRTAVKADVNPVPAKFFDGIIDGLTEFVGPMALLMINDHVRDLGESLAAFPQARLGELIGLVSREIVDNDSRARFQKQMAEKIRTLTSS